MKTQEDQEKFRESEEWERKSSQMLPLKKYKTVKIQILFILMKKHFNLIWQ